MGKSFKRNQFDSNAKVRAGEEDKWKRSDRQAIRRTVKRVIDLVPELSDEELDRIDDMEILDKEHARDVYNAPKDGKHRIRKGSNEDEDEFEERRLKALRK